MPSSSRTGAQRRQHLCYDPVAPRMLSCDVATPPRAGHFPEGGTIAQRSGLALDRGNVVLPVVNALSPPKVTLQPGTVSIEPHYQQVLWVEAQSHHPMHSFASHDVAVALVLKQRCRGHPNRLFTDRSKGLGQGVKWLASNSPCGIHCSNLTAPLYQSDNGALFNFFHDYVTVGLGRYRDAFKHGA